ncbi:GTPase IMAP family member 8-like [Halichoeres trimaculatus]|uniref:GTPase IMAP family member 8-like n=1 Tax=Halichoeres trimaculatus TaxID=147232 RepID=UPI003D9F3708
MNDPELKIVMIGRSKAGKSATGNNILGRKGFKSCISNSPVTQKCQVERVQLEEQNLSVIDTPDLFGGTTADALDEVAPEKVMEEIKQCLLQAPPGHVVFLVVLQLGSFAVREQQTVKLIQRSFGREAAHYTMALFTRGDDLKKEGGSIEEVIGPNQALRDFIRECRGGYHVFDNGDTDLPQVTELLRKITAILQRNGELGDTLEMSPEEKDFLQNAGKEAVGGQTLMQAYLDGVFVGVCIQALRISSSQALRERMAGDKFAVLISVVVAGALGGMFGAAKLGLFKLIRGK